MPCSSWISHDRGRKQNSLRSEEHTSELQSPCNLVCRLLLEKKKTQTADALWQNNPRLRTSMVAARGPGAVMTVPITLEPCTGILNDTNVTMSCTRPTCATVV